ncbi:MAG: acetyltransferase [Rhizobiaceae bacterium]|nr:acetyltransferase [Rhizobiaceae bacterium]
MSGRLLIVGAGGHGRVVADAALEAGFADIAFLDDSVAANPTSGPFAVIGPLADIERLAGAWPSAIAAVGNNARRLELLARLRGAGYATPLVRHPAAALSRHATVGAGVFVAAGAVVNIGARLGDAVIVNTGATIDHDCVLADGVHVSPGAHLGGTVKVGPRSWIGVGTAVRHGLTIGSDAIVGAGAAVVSDVADDITVVGVPARRRLDPTKG